MKVKYTLTAALFASGFFGGIAQAQEPKTPLAIWAQNSLRLCNQQAHPETWSSFEKQQYKRPRSAGECLLDHQRTASVCYRTAIDREDAWTTDREPSQALRKGCRKALRSIQAKYGAYTEDIPEGISELAYRTPAERRLDMILTTKAGMLEFPARQFRWCTKLFGKEQRECHRLYQGYVKFFGTIQHERLVRRYVRQMITGCRKHLGSKCGM